MPGVEDLFIPRNPKSIPVRPLDKGMYRNLPPQLIPEGGFFTLQDFITTETGVIRRPGYAFYAGGTQVVAADRPLIDIVPFWKTDGTQVGVLVGNRYPMILNASAAPTTQYWTYSSNTIAASGAIITGASTTWQTVGDILPNDVIILDADGSGDGPEELIISSVDSDTQVTLTSTPSGTYGAGTDYSIRRVFNVDSEYLIDSTVVDNKVIFTDHTRTPYSFDGTTYSDYDSSITFICGCLCYFADRLWMGNIIESGNYHPQRIRWSSATDRTSFADADYLDLPYTPGIIRRLVVMGNTLVAFYGDAIFIGRPTNNTDLPYSFQKIETGGVGLIGPKAIAPVFDGLAFIGQDNIYLLTAQGIKPPIGNPVVKATIRNSSDLRLCYAATDQKNDCVVFGFPEDSTNMVKLWRYNYKTGGWSYDNIEASFISNPFLSLSLTWADLSSYTWATISSTYPTWNDLTGNTTFRDFFRGNNGFVYKLSTDDSTDAGSEQISTIIETGDIDLNLPDDDKTWLRIALKLSDRPSSALTFTVTGSHDGGYTWSSLGTLTIAAGEREGKVNFHLTSSACRFRFTSNSDVTPYTVTEIVYRIRQRGLEVQFD